MILSLFKRKASRNSVRAVYGAIVAAARHPRFYAQWGVADTVDGRYDMIVLHAVLVLDRLVAEGEAWATSRLARRSAAWPRSFTGAPTPIHLPSMPRTPRRFARRSIAIFLQAPALRKGLAVLPPTCSECAANCMNAQQGPFCRVS